MDAWHESDDSEQCPVSQFLGMTEDECSVRLASHKSHKAPLVGSRNFPWMSGFGSEPALRENASPLRPAGPASTMQSVKISVQAAS